MSAPVSCGEEPAVSRMNGKRQGPAHPGNGIFCRGLYGQTGKF